MAKPLKKVRRKLRGLADEAGITTPKTAKRTGKSTPARTPARKR